MAQQIKIEQREQDQERDKSGKVEPGLGQHGVFKKTQKTQGVDHSKEDIEELEEKLAGKCSYVHTVQYFIPFLERRCDIK